MGQIHSNSNEVIEDPDLQLSLNIDPNKPVKQQLKQLLNWSLSQIREIYAPFRRRKSSPVLNRSQFLRFIQLTRISSFHIYNTICRKQAIDVFEVVCMLVLGAYTTYIYKIQFLFNVFDFECKKNLSFAQLLLLFKSLLRAFCHLTGQPLPQNSVLDKVGNSMFSKADLNNDQYLEVAEIVSWFESTSENLILFKLFEPNAYGKQDYFVFNSFCPYTEEQAAIIHDRLNKIYRKQKIEEEQYTLMKSIPKTRKDTKAKMTMVSSATQLSLKNSSRVMSSEKENRSRFFPINSTTVGLRFGDLSEGLTNVQSKVFKMSSRKKFENIIIIKGKTITKKQVFELRQYFDGMSTGKKHIQIQDFIQSFNQEKYNHMKSVAASLFNFLDKHQNGKVQFMDLVTKLYPNLSQRHVQIINTWNDEYNRSFSIDKKIKSNRTSEEVKKRVLPRTCIPRLQQLFKFFDAEGKNYVSMDNLRRVLGNACSEKQIEALFSSCDADKDGKLSLKQFVHVLLPIDLEIEGI